MDTIKNARRSRRHVPFDRALEVGLADRAVVDEDRGAGAVLFCQEPRGHLQRERERGSDGYRRVDATGEETVVPIVTYVVQVVAFPLLAH